MTSRQAVNLSETSPLPKGNSESRASERRPGWSRCRSACCWASFWWTVSGSVSPAFFPDLQGKGEACSYSPLPCSELGWAQAEGERTLGPERLSGPSEPEKGRAGSLGRELVAEVVEDTSGELGLSGEPAEPTQPLSGGPKLSLSPVLRAKRGTFLSWPMFTQQLTPCPHLAGSLSPLPS